MKKKKAYGQFNTTNSTFILNGFEHFVKNKSVCDPFAGNGDLLNWAETHGATKAYGYDIDETKQCQNIKTRDSLLSSSREEFLITNPPYLASNKFDGDKSHFLGFEDLYHAALSRMLECSEGIAIVPVNFLSSENSERIRSVFFQVHKIDKIRYFSRQVFADTKYNVICFHFAKRHTEECCDVLNIEMVYEKSTLSVRLDKTHGWRIGGEDLGKIQQQSNTLKIRRLHIDDAREGNIKIKRFVNDTKKITDASVSAEHYHMLKKNKIVLFSIDGTGANKIRLESIDQLHADALYSITTSRNCIQLVFGTEVTVDVQQALIEAFNRLFNQYRKKYHSLFLTNFRENNRKKVGFDFVYAFLNYIYSRKIYETNN